MDGSARMTVAPARSSSDGTGRALTVMLTSVAYFMVTLDALVVVTALPSIHRQLGGGVGTLQWTVSAYTIAFGAGILTASALGDRLGRRRVVCLRSDPVHRLVGRVRLGANSWDSHRLPCAPGCRCRGRHAPRPHVAHLGVPHGAPRCRRRDLGWNRRPRRRLWSTGRWSCHPGPELALDLLDQRADRGAGRHRVALPALGELGATHPARRAGARTRFWRLRLPHLGSCRGWADRLGIQPESGRTAGRSHPAGGLRRPGDTNIRSDDSHGTLPLHRVLVCRRDPVPDEWGHLLCCLSHQPVLPVRSGRLPPRDRSAVSPLDSYSAGGGTDRRGALGQGGRDVCLSSPVW